MALGDRLDPKDDIRTRLSPPADPEEMPAVMQCPSGHKAHRFIIDTGLVLAVAGHQGPEIRIPCWACPDCTVVYRFQECRLLPGDEGRP